MILELDTASSVPLYLQLRNQIVMGIGRGELLPGESLPTVRQLAKDAGLNAMTVNKAYGLLRDEGLILTDRRKGAMVAPAGCAPSQQTRLAKELVLLAAESRALGFSREDFLTFCSKMFDQLFPRQEVYEK